MQIPQQQQQGARQPGLARRRQSVPQQQRKVGPRFQSQRARQLALWRNLGVGLQPALEERGVQRLVVPL